MSDETKNRSHPPASGVTADNSVRSLEKKQRFLLVLEMYLVVAVGSVIMVLRPEEHAIRLILDFAMCSIVTYWCVVDSRMRGSPILYSLHWIIFFTWPIAVPIYLIQSRRLRGLGLALIHGIGLFAACLATYHLTGYLAYGAAWMK